MGELWEKSRKGSGPMVVDSLDDLEGAAYDTNQALHDVLAMPELSHRAFLTLSTLQSRIWGALLHHEQRKGH